IDLEYGRIPEYFREVYRPLFARIRVRPEILATADAWAAQHLARRVIGVQVRTWRDEPRRYRKYHQPALGRLRRLMAGADPAARFLVVSDSDEVAPLLAGEFGDERVFCYPRKTSRNRSWQSVEGVIEDLVDLLLLSRSERLFASYLSTFSEAAWWLGGARAEVSVF
ncbi:MAG: hypothetical protein ACREQZ_15955, partial [Woeseiaceae bacterium]